MMTKKTFVWELVYIMDITFNIWKQNHLCIEIFDLV